METDYNKQATDFLEKTGAKIELRFNKLGKHFDDDKTDRNIWEFRIVRGNRVYQSMFGDSINNTEKMFNKYFRFKNYNYTLQCLNMPLNDLRFEDIGAYSHRIKYEKAIKEQQNWGLAGTDDRPNAYDILAYMQKYEPADNIDDFAEEFSYTKPSQAIKVYEAVKKEWQAIKELFTDDEIAELQEIN